MSNPFQPAIEYASREEIKLFQEEKLRQHIAYLQAHSPYYQHQFEQHHIDTAKIRTLEDLHQLPFTEKHDLQLHNMDFLCVPTEKIIDYITTSGTLGDPVTFACTERDLQRLAYNEALSFTCAGITSSSVVQLMTTLDKRFMAGMAYFLGLRSIGAGIIRVGNGIPELQWDTIQRLQPDTAMCIPSFILHLIEYAEAHNIDYRHSSIKRVIGIGEGLRDQHFQLNELGKRIHQKWPELQLFATYSSTEMSATFPECSYAQGGHQHPELLIVEIVDEDGQPVPDGQPGEVVVTTLGVEAMPLLRFRTGDIAALHTDSCPCGRTTPRISPILGRRNHMIKYKGTTLYPPAIDEVIRTTEYIQNHYTTVTTTPEGTEQVTITIGLRYQPAFDVIKNLKDRFRARIRVAPEIRIAPTDAIEKITHPAMSRKPLTFFDERAK